MEIIFEEKNFYSSPVLRTEMFKKISSLERFISRIKTPVGILIEVQKMSYYRPSKKISFRAVANMSLPGKLLRIEAERADILTAINDIKEKFEPLLAKYKKKRSVRVKRGMRELKDKIRETPPLSETNDNL